MNSFDLFGYHLINGWAGHIPLADGFLSFIAQYALELYVLLFLAAWLFLPKRDTNSRHTLVIMGFAGLLALLFNILISHLWFRPRPFALLPKGSFIQLVPHALDASFPSDHTAGSFGFAGASWRKTGRWISYSFTLLAVLTACARLYTGLHWPTDILAGIVVGIASARIAWRFNKHLTGITNLGLRLSLPFLSSIQK